MRIIRSLTILGALLALSASAALAETARLADGTAVRVRLTADVTSAQATVGARVDMQIAEPVVLRGTVVIPAGAVAWGAVQDVKKGKGLRFDIEGVRLPNQDLVKLRCSPHKTTNASRDEIKVETQVGADVGATKGSEYTAYLDQDVNVEVAGAAPAAAPAAPTVSPAPAPKPPAPQVEAAPAPAAPVVAAPPAPVAPPAASVPAAPAAPAVAHPAIAVSPSEYIRVECYSDPLGADIMIDDEFHGSTPSILRLPPGSHQLEFRLMGYKAHPETLNLTPGTGLQTVRANLEKQP